MIKFYEIKWLLLKINENEQIKVYENLRKIDEIQKKIIYVFEK